MGDPVATDYTANSTDASIGIVVADWHQEISCALLGQVLTRLEQCGVAKEDICICHVPGAMELPFAARQMSQVQEPSAVIVLGCVTKFNAPSDPTGAQGLNHQYDVICQSVTQGITNLNLHSDIPFIFGVLMADNVEEARTLVKAGDGVGTDCANSALKMVDMMSKLVNF